MPLITIFLFGILSASFALIFELLLPMAHPASLVISETLVSKTLVTLLSIALIEEASKYIFLKQYALRFLAEKKLLARDALFLGISFGIGFSTLEILLIQNKTLMLPGLASLGASCLHITTSLILALALFLFAEKRFLTFLVFAAAILLHTLYNMMVLIVL